MSIGILVFTNRIARCIEGWKGDAMLMLKFIPVIFEFSNRGLAHGEVQLLS